MSSDGGAAAGAPAPDEHAATAPLPRADPAGADRDPLPDGSARLLAEAMTRSGLLWVRVRDDGGPGTAHAVWHVWHDPGDGPRAYVVSGPGEQHLPWLPDEVELVLRSKDSGGRLLTVPATATVLDPGSPAWDTAVEVLRPERLNATGDVVARWRERATVHALRPHGPALESPGHHDTGDGATPVRPAAPATVGRRPWHWRGRAGARRNTDR